MGWPLIVIGAIFIAVGINNKAPQFQQILRADFTGERNYFNWIVAIFAIGALGVVKEARTISDAFLVLVILVLILSPSQSGFFNRLNTELTERN
jgi:hypothetical protein